MKSILYSILGLSILIFTQSGWAQSRCSEVYREIQSRPLEFLEEQQLLFEFEKTKQEAQKTNLLSEANQHLYSLVVTANRILDQAIDHIIAVNFMRLPQEISAQRAHMAEYLIEQLQQSFRIGNNAMTEAMNNRMNIEIGELQAKTEALKQRRAIGFGRDQSSESFHAEKGEKQPIGFRPRAKEEVAEVEVAENISLGFNRRSERELQESIKELVEYQEVLDGVISQPIGFIHRKGSAKETAEPEPIGFIHPKPVSERITEARLHKLVFDIETGTFHFQKGEP